MFDAETTVFVKEKSSVRSAQCTGVFPWQNSLNRGTNYYPIQHVHQIYPPATIQTDVYFERLKKHITKPNSLISIFYEYTIHLLTQKYF